MTYWVNDPRKITPLTDGTTVTAVNSATGGQSGFTPATNNTGTVTYRTASGGRYRFDTGASSSIARGDVTVATTTVATSAMFDLTGQTPDGVSLLRFFGTGQAGAGLAVIWDTDNFIKVINAAGTIVFTSPATFTGGRIFLQFGAIRGTTTSNGTINFAAFVGANADGTTADWTYNVTNANTGTVNYTASRFGHEGQHLGTVVTAEYAQGDDATATFSTLGQLSSAKTGTLAVTSTGTLVFGGGIGPVAGSLALTSTGTLALGVTPKTGGTLALTSTGTLALGATPKTGGTLALTSTGTLALFAGNATGSLSLTSTGTLTLGALLATIKGTLALTSTGTLTLGGKPVTSGILTLTGLGVLGLSGIFTTRVRWWNGSSWQPTVIKYWNGIAWQSATVKVWDGTQWA